MIWLQGMDNVLTAWIVQWVKVAEDALKLPLRLRPLLLQLWAVSQVRGCVLQEVLTCSRAGVRQCGLLLDLTSQRLPGNRATDEKSLRLTKKKQKKNWKYVFFKMCEQFCWVLTFKNKLLSRIRLAAAITSMKNSFSSQNTVNLMWHFPQWNLVYSDFYICCCRLKRPLCLWMIPMKHL